MSNSTVCCQLQLNPDVTGVGVRAGLYAQVLLGWFASYVWPDTFAKNARTSYMTAIALLIAAIIQMTTQQLSLLDGIVVSLITSMMIIFAIASSPPVPRSQQDEPNDGEFDVDPNKSLTRFITQFCFVAFWGAWCLNMWSDPTHFGLKGDQAACNTNQGVTLVVFGREVHATDYRMRSAAISLVSFGLVIAIGSMFLTLEKFLRPVLMLFDSTRAHKKEHESKLLRTIRHSLQLMSLGTLIYLIVVTEKTIKKNDGDGITASWTYGQTIAVILLLQQLMDISSIWMEKRQEQKEESDKQDSQGDIAMPDWQRTS